MTDCKFKIGQVYKTRNGRYEYKVLETSRPNENGFSLVAMETTSGAVNSFTNDGIFLHGRAVTIF